MAAFHRILLLKNMLPILVRNQARILRLAAMCLLFLLQVHLAMAQVVINEIMAAPISPEPEWVELFNAGPDTFVLRNLYLYDATSRSPLPETVVAPGHFVVLCKDTSALRATRMLPENAALIRITLPSLNNTGEVLKLATKDSILIDSVWYQMAWGSPGLSLERVDAQKPMLSKTNCRSCISGSGATCGSDNSVSPREGDVSIVSAFVQAADRTIRVNVRNMGPTSINDIKLSVVANSLSISEYITPLLEPFEERVFAMAIDSITRKVQHTGYMKTRLQVYSANDTRRSNDTMMLSIYVTPLRGMLRINEVLFDPAPVSAAAMAEFIEIVNTGVTGYATNGLELRIDDTTVSLPSDTIPAGEAVVVTADSLAGRAWRRDGGRVLITEKSFSLRSTWDSVLVTDPYGYVIDSLCYSSEWHSKHIGVTKGVSLEKRSPFLSSWQQASWTSCADSAGATPGSKNSVSRELQTVQHCSASPNPFSPLGNRGEAQSTVLQLVSPFSEALWTVRVFDTHGNELQILRNGEYDIGRTTGIWEGRNESGDAFPVGPYIVSVVAVDAGSGAVFSECFVTVISE